MSGDAVSRAVQTPRWEKALVDGMSHSPHFFGGRAAGGVRNHWALRCGQCPWNERAAQPRDAAPELPEGKLTWCAEIARTSSGMVQQCVSVMHSAVSSAVAGDAANAVQLDVVCLQLEEIQQDIEGLAAHCSDV